MLTRNRTVCILGAVALVAAGLAYAGAAEITKGDAAGQSKALVAAAQKTYDKLFSLFSAGRFDDLDRIYLWSRRVMDAESRANSDTPSGQLGAASAHQKRMVELDGVYSKLQKGGQAASDTAATEYYLLEAAAFVADAYARPTVPRVK